MLAQDVLRVVRKYQDALKAAGIVTDFVVVFGSQATGKAHEWSDIDLLVVSAQFDGMTDRRGINQLWRLAAQVDSRIEPLPCGAQQWRDDDASALIEMARRQGMILKAA
ncbi:MAG: nucleotidyltransferase domain-containing protein [Trichloromonadaceae bacterium]